MGLFKKNADLKIIGRQVHGTGGSSITATGEPLVGPAVGAYAQVIAPRRARYHNYVTSKDHDPEQAEGPGGQGGLFSAVPPSKPKLSHLYATKGQEHLVPAVLEQALKTSMARWGSIPEASDDLSPYSSKIAKTAIRLGIATAPSRNPQVETVNPDNFRTSEEKVRDAHNYTRAHASTSEFDVARASDEMRERIKSARRNLSPHQFKEPSPDQQLGLF